MILRSDLFPIWVKVMSKSMENVTHFNRQMIICTLKRRTLLEWAHRKTKIADYSVNSEDVHTQVGQ